MNTPFARTEMELADQLSIPDSSNKRRLAGLACIGLSGLIALGTAAANVLPDYAERLDQQDLPPTHEDFCKENRDAFLSSCAPISPDEPVTLDPYLPTPRS